MIDVVKVIVAMILIVVVWLGYLLLTPMGWYSLILAGLAIFFKQVRHRAFERWKKDDMKINAILGGRITHTISGRVGYNAIKTGHRRYRIGEFIINTLFWFDPHHCFKSINWDLFPNEREALTVQYCLERDLGIENLKAIL